MNIAIVTGASSGIGREFVRLLDAQKKYDAIWVIARRKERLLALAKQSEIEPEFTTDTYFTFKYSPNFFSNSSV